MSLNLDGLALELTHDAVYEPSDDSLLLAKYSGNLKGKILDIGCGCGIQALVNASKNPENRVLGIDINREAVKCSAYNARRNAIENVSFAVSDLFSEIPKERFDGLIFNPPYLPTVKSEKIEGELNRAFDGGPDGRMVIDRFLSGFDEYLSDDGTLLMLQSSLNDVEKTISILEEKRFMVEVKEGASFFFEKLYVLEAKRK